ncbi:MAG: hypothetical protein U5J99_03350 [Parvularculaceae bacterium]|nr:hypothetical protein [Parvularculaceae bacterium]
MLLMLLAANAAAAETIVVRPDRCAAPADMPLIIDLGDVELFTQTPEEMIGKVLIIYPPVGDGWASARLLMRFDFETAPAPLETCRRPRLFELPR